MFPINLQNPRSQDKKEISQCAERIKKREIRRQRIIKGVRLVATPRRRLKTARTGL
jgi:hypothetical protein